MQYRIPDNITKVYTLAKIILFPVNLQKKLGLSVIKENVSGTSFLYWGEIQTILKHYMK